MYSMHKILYTKVGYSLGMLNPSALTPAVLPQYMPVLGSYRLGFGATALGFSYMSFRVIHRQSQSGLIFYFF